MMTSQVPETESAHKLPSDGHNLTTEIQKGYGRRHTQGILLFYCFFTIFFVRLSISVAIVSMTDRNSSNYDFEQFDWSENEKSTVLSSFFWGYMIVQAPAGFLGQSLSPKILLLCANTVGSILTCLTPMAAHYGGFALVSAFRAGVGLAQGFVVPLSYNIISRWSPPDERNRFVGFSFNGGTLGACVSLPVAGLLAQSSGGWPSIFYFTALLSLSWSVLWWLLGADDPGSHPNISDEEKSYIQTSLGDSVDHKRLETPWRAIFTSVPFLALVAVQITNGWAFSILITETPTFINYVLGFNIGANGFISALPFLSMWLLTFPVCFLADYIKKRQLLPDSVVRKGWTTISQTGGSLMLVILGFVGYDATAAVITLTIAVSLSAFIFSGFSINHLDLAPNFAGVLMGIANGLENVTTIIAPLTVGWIVKDPSKLEQWRLEFYLTAFVTILGNVIFNVFGSTRVQEWNSAIDKTKSGSRTRQQTVTQ